MARASVIPVTDLKANAAELLRSIAEEEGSVTITQNGEPRAVMMSVAEYDRWRSALALLKLVGHSEASLLAGKVVSQEDVFQRAEAVLARRRS